MLRMVRLVVALAAVVVAGVPLSACNTAAGIGEDVSAAGHAVSTTATKVKSDF
jgi:predicted small secreted protein